ncbi:hypothetical protein Esti_004578 [Eimeria stiedai]
MDSQRGSPDLLLSQSQHEAALDESDSSSLRVFKVAPLLRGPTKALRNSAEGRGIGRVLSTKKGSSDCEATARCEGEGPESRSAEEQRDLSADNVLPAGGKRARLQTTAEKSQVASRKEGEVLEEHSSTRKKGILCASEGASVHVTPQESLGVSHGAAVSTEQDAASSTSGAGVAGSSWAMLQGAGALLVPPEPSTTEDAPATSAALLQAQQRQVHNASSSQSEPSQRRPGNDELEAAQALLMLHPQEPVGADQSSSSSLPSIGLWSTTPAYLLSNSPAAVLSIMPSVFFQRGQAFVLSIVFADASRATLPAASPMLPVQEGGSPGHHGEMLMPQVASNDTPSANPTQQMGSLSYSAEATVTRAPRPPSTSSEHLSQDATAQASEGAPLQSEHPFSRVPHVRPSDQLRRRFDPTRVASEGVVCESITCRLVKLRSLLAQQFLSGEELDELTDVLQQVMSYAYFRETSRTENSHPSVALRALGRRFVMLDQVVAALQVLGEKLPAQWWNAFVSRIPMEYRQSPPHSGRNAMENFNLMMIARLTEAMRLLRTGVRPPRQEVVTIKKLLFTSFLTPYYFKLSRWDAWRADDTEFERQQAQTSR